MPEPVNRIEVEPTARRMELEPATPEDSQWLGDQDQSPRGGRLLIRLDDEQDVTGHLASEDPTVVRVVVQDEEMDTEGHAISIRLPSADEADAFRRRLLLTGVLVGTVLVGSAGAALAVSQGLDAPATQAAGQMVDVSYEDTTPNDATV